MQYLSADDLTSAFVSTVNSLLLKGIYKNQKELVSALGWYESSLSSVMNGKRDVPAQYAYKLFQILSDKGLQKDYPQLCNRFDNLVKDQYQRLSEFIMMVSSVIYSGLFQNVADVATELSIDQNSLQDILDQKKMPSWELIEKVKDIIRGRKLEAEGAKYWESPDKTFALKEETLIYALDEISDHENRLIVMEAKLDVMMQAIERIESGLYPERKNTIKIDYEKRVEEVANHLRKYYQDVKGTSPNSIAYRMTNRQRVMNQMAELRQELQPKKENTEGDTDHNDIN